MPLDHRPQLMDDINDGKVLLEDLGMKELKSLVTGTTMDYNPPEPFFTRVWHELSKGLKAEAIIAEQKAAAEEKKVKAEMEAKRAEAARISAAYKVKREKVIKTDFFKG